VPWPLAVWMLGMEWRYALIGAGGYGAAAAGWFLFWFQQQVNLKRHPPKHRWYVSQDHRPGYRWPGSSWLDRYLNEMAYESATTPEDENRWLCWSTLVATLLLGVPFYVQGWITFLFHTP
jgi:hypothetical protein